MSLSERVQQLNHEIGDAVEKALAGLRREIAGRVRESSEEVLRRLEEVSPELPSSYLRQEDFHSATERLHADSRRGALGELVHSVAALDRGRSQTEILTALLAESGYFASRAALLIVRGGDVRGWGGHGMDAEAAIREVSLTPPADSPWSRVVAGGAGERLSAEDCALLCGRIEIPAPQAGLLVPMVLRDKVAAVLYADRTDGRELLAEPFQLLVHLASLSIELLPFRERASTVTLQPFAADASAATDATDASATGDASAAADAAPAAAVDSTPSPAAAPEAPEAAATAPSAIAPADEPTSTPAAPEAPAAPEPEAAPPAEPESAPEAEPWRTAPDSPSPVAAVSVGDNSIPTREHPLPVPPALAAASGRDTVLLQRSWLQPSAPEPAAAPPEPRPLSAPPAATPAWSAPGSASSPIGDPGLGGDSLDAGRSPSLGGGTAAEVNPPSDVQGPGWAFSTTRVPVSPNEEAIHEEARRLARLLVSEIKLYNEEQVEAGRRNRDLYERLRDDIDRSRQMYEERIDPRLVKSTDYFYQELVRILAAGDAKVLGI
jgi:hypothetical protein